MFEICCIFRAFGQYLPQGRACHERRKPLDSLVRMRSPVQIWLAAPNPLKSSDFRGFLLLLQKISTGKFKIANSAKTVRPHPFLPLFEEGMRSDYGQKNHNESTIFGLPEMTGGPTFVTPKGVSPPSEKEARDCTLIWCVPHLIRPPERVATFPRGRLCAVQAESASISSAHPSRWRAFCRNAETVFR